MFIVQNNICINFVKLWFSSLQSALRKTVKRFLFLGCDNAYSFSVVSSNLAPKTVRILVSSANYSLPKV